MKNASKNFFKTNLLFLLESKKLTPAQFSREIGISKQAVSSWIKEESNISVQHSIEVAAFFSISLDALFLYDMQAAQAMNNLAEIDIFSNSDVAFTAVDIMGIGNYCNPAMADLLEYNREELISRHSYELIHPFDMQRYRTEMKKLRGGEAEFVQIDLKYLLGSGKFSWVRQFIIRSPRDKRFYIFAFPFSDNHHQPLELKRERFFLENVALQELDYCKVQSFFPKEVEILNHFKQDLSLNIDQSVFQCLIRSMFYQVMFIEKEDESGAVKFSSRNENSDIFISALVNCKLNAKPMSLVRLKRIAAMINASVEETMAGNLYCLTFILHNQ